jgi:hypothetical protein
VTDPKVVFSLPDNGGRRSGIDRRRFSYSAHIPERRRGIERRSGRDRRQLLGLKGKTRNKSWASLAKEGRRVERRIALKRSPA